MKIKTHSIKQEVDVFLACRKIIISVFKDTLNNA